MVYFMIYYLVGSDAYYTIFVLKVVNGIWNVYYIEYYHLVYSIPVRKLLVSLSATFTILNCSAFFSYVFYNNGWIKIDPIITTLIPGLFFIKYVNIKIEERIYDHSYNNPKLLKKLDDVNIILYQINL
jgi:hypothetical protein